MKNAKFHAGYVFEIHFNPGQISLSGCYEIFPYFSVELEVAKSLDLPQLAPTPRFNDVLWEIVKISGI